MISVVEEDLQKYEDTLYLDNYRIAINYINISGNEDYSTEKEVVLHENTEVIGGCCFNSSHISSFVCFNDFKEIEIQGFGSCNFEEIIFDYPIILGEGAFEYNYNLRNLKLNCDFIPKECFDGIGEYVEEGANIVLENTKYIMESAFRNAKINTIKFPDTLTYIGEYSFPYAEFKNELVFNDNLKRIGGSAFSGAKFKNGILKLPVGLEDIEYKAFENSNLTDLYIPCTVKTIGNLDVDFNNVGKGIKLHMSQATFNRLNARRKLRTDNIEIENIDKLIDTMSFKDINRKNLEETKIIR